MLASTGVALAAALLPSPLGAQSYEVLHAFTFDDEGSIPFGAALVQGSDGKFYGTTWGWDSIFRIDTSGSFEMLHEFEGHQPKAGLVEDPDGNFYGVTGYGGDGYLTGSCSTSSGCGTFFRMDSSGSVTFLHNFTDVEGTHPASRLVLGADGNFYGTADDDEIDCSCSNRNGAVFQIDHDGVLTTLHSFRTDSDGQYPNGGLTLGNDGSFYGTTRRGGMFVASYGDAGTVFRIMPSGQFQVLHRFSGGDGAYPVAEVVQGSDGRFYGTTSAGGAHGYGTVFRIDAAGSFMTLHDFSWESDGGCPRAGLVQGSDGAFYGTTTGDSFPQYCSQGQDSAAPYGSIFRIDANGSLMTLHTFIGSDGQGPTAALVQGNDGSFYGTTSSGGPDNAGVVFRLTVPLACLSAVQISGPDAVCAGQSSTIGAGAGFSSYHWSTGAVTQSISVAPSQTTTYSVDATGQYSCTSSASKTVIVNPASPIPSITQSANPDGSVRLSSSAASSYLWSTGATTQWIDVSGSGAYWVTVTNPAGCSATSETTNVSVTPTGTAVSVANGDVTTTFSNVSSGGTTTVTPIDPETAGSLPVGGYSISALGVGYEIATTATISGEIIIGFEVPESVDEVTFNSLRALHGELGSLVDRTYFSLEGCVPAPDSPCPAPNFATRTIYARVSSLSPFVLATVGTPFVQAVTVPADPAAVSTTVNVQATFTDPGAHTALWTWDDGTTSAGLVTESGGHGTVTGSHVYTVAGVYRVTLTVTDSGGSSGQRVSPFLVVYDPRGGFVTGGGWINSPSGAQVASPTLTGRANFGFVAKYLKGATVPTGETEFEFRAGNLFLRSTAYQWLVISGARAQYKGTGTINGSGNFGFLLTAVDGQLNGGGGADKLRIKIWDKSNGDLVVYDNQVACGDTAENADPCTGLAGGSIVIHR